MKNEIILFESEDMTLEVNIKDETVWLTQKQIADLFSKDRTVITKHITNIFKEGELVKESVCAKNAHTACDGKIYETDYYNLDVIISVGYRVKSKRGTQFRIWANKILKEYIIKGYAINQKRLEYLEKTVKLIDIASRVEDDNQSTEILKIIKEYTTALDLLDNYDYKEVKKPKGTRSEDKITYENCLAIIRMMKFNEKSKLFALEKDKGLESIINNLYQSYNNKDVYESTEEKAANFLYLIIKNHVFVDGNKRIAAAS